MSVGNSDSKNIEEKIYDVDVVGTRDWFLQSIVEIVVFSGAEIGVTLNVGGSVVSGMMISGKTFFKELGEALQSQPQEEHGIHATLGKAWSQHQKIYDKPENAPESWEPPKANYVHLRNARIYAPGQPPLPNNQGFLWRAKISAIDAFSLNNLILD